MFDADTVALIAGAPRIDGLDLDDLPRRLTDAYASIVATRIRLRRTTEDRALPDDIANVIGEMRRLAFTHEAFVSVLPNRMDRASAAFVAGAAHHVCLMAEQVVGGPSRPSELELAAISPEVSATLLFMVAEASADAAEMSKSIRMPTDAGIEAALLSSIVDLANGRLQRMLARVGPPPERFLAAEPCQRAVRSLFYLILKGLRLLAADMLGVEALPLPDLSSTDPVFAFEHVRTLCVDSLEDLLGREGAIPYSLYPGPLHLASLLSAIAKDLSSSAVAKVPPPDGIDGGRWQALARSVANRRPYLWRNHRQAIQAGYLEIGTSAVVSFPTGAGKSTIAELKIAAALLRGSKVIFLAPTLALVDQTATALSATFREADVGRELPEDLPFDFGADPLPTISVLTPERCLAMLSFDRTVLADVGLLVFDECHLLHPRDLERSRRAIDAALCLLNFSAIAPDADYLFLSAMMKNAEEIAGWIAELTGRRCLPLALTWKPTRQVRGCVVYEAEGIKRLKQRLAETRRRVTNRDPPVALKRALIARPFGLFCLHQTWQSRARRDYALLPLLDQEIQLSTGRATDGSWYLTPNGNQVASALAAETAAQALKTLIFTQTIPLCNGATKTLVAALGPPQVTLNAEEKRFYEQAEAEMGGPDYVYLAVSKGVVNAGCACHHGLLLPSERHLHESLFKRPDGIHTLVATSTLAQGMNLPSEVVIISGDSRFDADAGRVQQLEAHELLNAAGRAGRAGEVSNGFVLVVPSKVVDIDTLNNRINSYWTDLRAIFSQSDQCLDIEDPLEPLLDRIHAAAGALDEMTQYLVSRLPVGAAGAADANGPARALLNRSLAAYQARRRGDQQWMETRLEAIIAIQRADPDLPAILTWVERLAAGTGVPIPIVRSLGRALRDARPEPDATTGDWFEWVFGWLERQPDVLPKLIRRESLEGLFGKSYKDLTTDAARGRHVCPTLKHLLHGWMSGRTLAELESDFGTAANRVGKCEHAREFVVRLVPELAHIFGLTAHVVRALRFEAGEIEELPRMLMTLAACVRQGYDRPEKLENRGTLSRVGVHRAFQQLEV